MEEERPVIQQIKAVKHKMPEVVKVTKEEIKREEIPQNIEEKPVIKEKVIEPRIISNKTESITLPPSVNSNLPIAEVREVASAPQISLPQQQTSQPHARRGYLGGAHYHCSGSARRNPCPYRSPLSQKTGR